MRTEYTKQIYTDSGLPPIFVKGYSFTENKPTDNLRVYLLQKFISESILRGTSAIEKILMDFDSVGDRFVMLLLSGDNITGTIDIKNQKIIHEKASRPGILKHESKPLNSYQRKNLRDAQLKVLSNPDLQRYKDKIISQQKEIDSLRKVSLAYVMKLQAHGITV